LVVTRVSQATDLAPRTQGRQLRVFSLDYVSAVDAQTVIEGLLSPAGQSFVTQSASADNRKTQELVVVEDLPEYVQRIEQYVRQVDMAHGEKYSGAVCGPHEVTVIPPPSGPDDIPPAIRLPETVTVEPEANRLTIRLPGTPSGG